MDKSDRVDNLLRDGHSEFLAAAIVVAESLSEIAYSIKRLGTADAATPLGAIEALMMTIGKTDEGGSLADAMRNGLGEIADAVNNRP